MHEHTECSHNLKYCPKCDVVYCTMCKREWFGHNHYTYTYPYTYPYKVWYSTVNDNGDTITVSSDNTDVCSHS